MDSATGEGAHAFVGNEADDEDASSKGDVDGVDGAEMGLAIDGDEGTLTNIGAEGNGSPKFQGQDLVGVNMGLGRGVVG